MRIFLLSCLILLATSAFALDFQVEKPLRDHLIEVNAEWKNHPEVLESLDNPVKFDSENQRIQAHLFEAIQVILHASGQGNTEKRAHLMQQLLDYAEEGNFPVNTYDKCRRPYFIDYKGTPCAVGFLMLNNGFHEEAKTVHQTMNTAYIRAIPQEWLSEWIEASNLSLDELALIQPGYPPSTIWTDLGAQLIGEVNAMVVYNDEVYIAGDFSINGVPSSFARVEGEELVSVATLNGIARDMELYQGKIWLAGVFNNGYNDLAVWDGNELTYTGAYLSKYGEAYDLKFHNDQLFICGFSTGFVGSDYTVAVLENDTWSPLGKFDNAVLSIEIYNEQLIAAGHFTAFFDDNWNEIPAAHVAKMANGQWLAMGAGINSTVRNLEVVNNQLWACADLFDEEENPGFGLGKLEGDAWISLTDPLVYELPLESRQSQGFRDVLYTGEQLIVCGKFLNPEIFINGGAVGSFFESDDQWLFSSMITPYQGVMNDLMGHGHMLYAAGNFEEMMFNYSDIVRTDLSTDIPEPMVNNDPVVLFPNPAKEQIHIQIDPSEYLQEVVIFGMDGRQIVRFSGEMLSSSSNTINLEDLALNPGVYVCRIEISGKRYTVRFIRQ